MICIRSSSWSSTRSILYYTSQTQTPLLLTHSTNAMLPTLISYRLHLSTKLTSSLQASEYFPQGSSKLWNPGTFVLCMPPPYAFIWVSHPRQFQHQTSPVFLHAMKTPNRIISIPTAKMPSFEFLPKTISANVRLPPAFSRSSNNRSSTSKGHWFVWRPRQSKPQR